MLGLMAIGFSACNPDEEPIEILPTSSNLTITIDHKMGTTDMVYNEDVVLPSDESVQISRLSYLLGSFFLVNKAGEKIELKDQYAFVEAHRGRTTFTLKDIPFGEYKSLGLSIGLDSNTNHGNPNQYDSDHPLAPINNSLHWSWTGGYIFTAIEGKMAKEDDKTFIFHLAGAQNRLDFVIDANFTTAATDASKEANLTYDVNEVFMNPALYSIADDGASTHSNTSPVTLKLIRNMTDVFTTLIMK